MSSFKLDSIEIGNASGMDAFLESPKTTKTASIRVASISTLDDFLRVSSQTLVHKSTKDLWTLREEGGEIYIDRLFQEGSPIKE